MPRSLASRNVARISNVAGPGRATNVAVASQRRSRVTVQVRAPDDDGTSDVPPDRHCIRVVDDDPNRVGLCRDVLEAAGYDTRVQTTSDSVGSAGVFLVAEHLIEQVSEQAPAEVIALTTDPGEHLGDVRALTWLRVPVEPDALLRAVEDVLDTHRSGPGR